MINWVLLGALVVFACSGFVWVKRREQRLHERYRRLLKTEAKRADEHVAQLQAFLSAIQASPNGVVILDSERRIEWCNQTAARLLGLDPVRDVAQHIAHLVREPQFLEYLSQEEFSHELRFDNKALQLHPYGLGSALLLVRDVTDVERAEQMRVDFVANVSHEIRTPLTVLSGFIETLQTIDLAPHEQKHYLQLMATQSQRLSALVADLLVLSRLDAKARPVLERVDIASLLQQCEHEARTLATVLKRKINITFDVEPGAQMLGSTSELQSAFSNLVSNAVRYTLDGGAVHVVWRGDKLSVRDSGLGIAPEHLPRLTERFYRVDKSRIRELGETAGTGLGLAIVKHVAQRHGAQLDIQSTVGVGSTFSLIF
ncbi:MAG: phosphate regulon sensor histidine kinase PhoR [Cytophagales bacterium]|nr:phosphate regulon sensor histidine kinase PhoR [Cytophagales bacterium]